MYQNNKYTSLNNNKVEPVEPVYMNIYQSKTYRKDLTGYISTMSQGFKKGIKWMTNSPTYPFL